MEWMEQFIDETLREVPKSRYRARTEKELRDHMRTEYEVLLGGGRTPEEAQTEVLRTMGEPERLQKEYETAWRNTPQVWAGRIALSIGAVIGSNIIFVLMFFLVVIFFGGLLVVLEGVSSGRIQLIGVLIRVLSYIMSFAAPISGSALFLRFCARNHRRPVWLVTAGLLSNWASMLLFWFFEFMGMTGPGVTCVTFVGCVLLGQLFGRLPLGREKDRVAA